MRHEFLVFVDNAERNDCHRTEYFCAPSRMFDMDDMDDLQLLEVPAACCYVDSMFHQLHVLGGSTNMDTGTSNRWIHGYGATGGPR